MAGRRVVVLGGLVVFVGGAGACIHHPCRAVVNGEAHDPLEMDHGNSGLQFCTEIED